MSGQLMAQWNGQRTQLLLVRGSRVSLVADGVTKDVAREVADLHGLALDIRPGAFR
jgi:hypothetical protein